MLSKEELIDYVSKWYKPPSPPPPQPPPPAATAPHAAPTATAVKAVAVKADSTPSGAALVAGGADAVSHSALSLCDLAEAAWNVFVCLPRRLPGDPAEVAQVTVTLGRAGVAAGVCPVPFLRALDGEDGVLTGHFKFFEFKLL